nr:hypothetical protein [Enterobacter asburiae]
MVTSRNIVVDSVSNNSDRNMVVNKEDGEPHSKRMDSKMPQWTSTTTYPFEASPGQEKPMNKFTPEYRKYLLRPIPDRNLSPSERADRKELYQIIQQERANDDSPPAPSNYTPADPYLNDNRKGLGGASRSD